MTIFVIDINTNYGHYSTSYIKQLCDFNNINFYVLKNNIPQNVFNRHPSWLKCFCHDIVDDDFIILWDADLVPNKLYNLKQFFNTGMLNMCVDYGLFTNPNYRFNEKFKYNCGLIGVPKTYNTFLKDIYFNSAATYPSFEQYYINDKIHDEHITVNELPLNLNHAYIENNEHVLNTHYTYSGKINNIMSHNITTHSSDIKGTI